METSKSDRTVYFRGSAYARATGGGISGSHFDVEIGEEYWISGVNVVKRRVSNRHWAGSGRIQIESVTVEDYLEHIEQDQINPFGSDACRSILENKPRAYSVLPE